jgi:hypothetical protein
MVRVLHWLASYDDIDLEDENVSKSIVADILNGDDDLHPILDDRLFDKAFFKILDDAYMGKLQQAIISFACDSDMDNIEISGLVAPTSLDSDTGSDSDSDEEAVVEAGVPEHSEISWIKAYESYMKDVCKNLHTWSKDRLQTMTIDDAPTKIHAIFALKNLVPRIKFLYRHKIFALILLLPSTSFPPLWSVLFYADLAKSLADVNDGIALVGVLSLVNSDIFDLTTSQRLITGSNRSC